MSYGDLSIIWLMESSTSAIYKPKVTGAMYKPHTVPTVGHFFLFLHDYHFSNIFRYSNIALTPIFQYWHILTIANLLKFTFTAVDRFYYREHHTKR